MYHHLIIQQRIHIVYNISAMVIVFLSFEAIEIAYTDKVDASQHILISEKSQGVFEIVKEGMKIQRLLERMADIKSQQMVQEYRNVLLQSPILVCLSAKSKKTTQPILQSISKSFQRFAIYIRVDKSEFKDLPFNRSVLIDNDVCYGQGLPQLRQKQELRFALMSILKEEEGGNNCVFIERNANQLKELKKEGFTYLISDFQEQTFLKAFKQATNAKKVPQNEDLAIKINEESSKFPFTKRYLLNLIRHHKETSLKQIVPYDLNKLSIESLLQDLFRQSTYYSISPKSWAPHNGSKQISAYVFHNISNMQLYLARASRIKQFTNEEQFQAKILAYYLHFIISPSSYALPQDKFASLMKFCKIKSFQNKRAFFNVRPYVQGLSIIDDLGLNSGEVFKIFSFGEYRGYQVKGIAGFLLSSLILNDSFNIKTVCEQTALLSINQMTHLIQFVNKDTLNQSKAQLYLCRVDFFSPLNLSNYKQINTVFHLSNKQMQIRLSLQQLHPRILIEMRQLLCQLNDQRLHMVRTLTVYYRWNTKLVNYYQVVLHRLSLIQQALKEIPLHNITNNHILDTYPQLACLLIKEDYSYFTVPSKNIYSPIEYTYDSTTLEAPKENHNPYLVYINKTCSFGVYNISFPVLSFLQWVKATNKYQIIEYISMINHTFEDFVIMDKRIKLQSTNDKKNAILVVDHVELCETLINRPKSNKTVLIFRLRKVNQIEDIGIISSEMPKNDNFKSSEDQLINILMRQGLRQFNEESQFQLYYWVFRQYIKIKCSLYKLNYNTAIQFAWILHKAISTNRHRLKQIKQNHPNLYVYLYTLPITKDNQKVVYNYRLFEYLHAYNLFEKILSKKWNYRLETYQNSSVAYWKSIIGTELTIKLTNSLSQYLLQVQRQQNESFDISQSYNDCLQLIRTITEPTSKQDEEKLPFSLYYDVFAKFEEMKHYNQIKQLQQNGNFLVIQDQASLSVTLLVKSEYLSIDCGENQRILCYSLAKDDRIFVLKRVGQDIVLQCILLTQQISLSSHIETTLPINSALVRDLLKDSIRTQMKIVSNTIYLVFISSNKLTALAFGANQMSQLIVKEFYLEETLTKARIVQGKSQVYLIYVTGESIFTISLEKSLENKPTFLKKSPGHIGDHSAVVLLQNSCYDLQFLTFQGNIMEITSLSSRSIIHNQRIPLAKSIKSATVNNGILFVFYKGEDSLYLYKLKEDSCERLWRYFWVEPSSKELYINEQSCCIIGGSYLKKIQLKNMQKLLKGHPI